MSTMHSDQPHVPAAAGCPPVLAADTPHNDVVDPPVEWPPAPPTRRRGRHASTRNNGFVDVTDRTLERDASTEATVAELSASRAMRLLDTAIEHLRTVLETSPDAATSARVERAIGDVSRASEDLRQLTDIQDVTA